MPAILDFRVSSGVGADRVTCDLPFNDASIELYAVVNLGGGTTAGTISTPSGWTQESGSPFNLGGSPYGVLALFKRVGYGGTSVSFLLSPSGSPFFADAVVFAIGEPDVTTPTLTPTSVTHTTTLSHAANSVTTTQPNQLLLGVWLGQISPLAFSGPFDMTEQVNIVGEIAGGVSGTNHFPMLISAANQAVAGASGTKLATTQFSENSLAILVAFRVNPNPSIPSVLYAAGGENLTAGATIALKCSVATSPTVAPSAMQYEYSYSLDNGGSWNLIGLSPVGVTSKTWTVPATLGNTNLIRVRAYDGTLYSLLYGYGAAFNIVAETTLGAPTITSPASGSVQAKSATQAITWNYAGGPGNPQTQFTLQWATNAAFSGATTIGPSSTALQSTTIDTTGVTDGLTVYVRVKTKGVSIYSAYSAAIAFVVASAPATPNITAPIAGSPPTSSSPTETITEASSFVARRMRTVQAGIEVQNDVVESNALSYVRPYAYANGVTVTIYVSVRNQYGLWSAEDSETVTPSYSGPTKPTLAIVKAPDSGYILLQITNSGSLSYNEIWRRDNGQAKALAIRVTPSLAANAQFADYATASGESVVYFARAYNGAVFTDSDDSTATSITLADIFLHAVSRDNTGSNVLGLSVHMWHLLGSAGHGFDEAQVTVDLLGRDDPGAIFGQMIQEKQAVQTFFRFSDQSQYDALLALVDAQANGAILLFRDSLGNRFYCQLGDLETTVVDEGYNASFSVEETDYREAL